MCYNLNSFSVEASVYLRLLGKMYLADRWWALVAPPLVCMTLSAALSDVRWLVVGLMIMFVAIPMFLALAYINYALSMEARWSVMAKELHVDNRGLHLRFDDLRMSERSITWQDVSGISVKDENFLLLLSVRRYTFLVIPFAELEQSGISLKQFSADIYQCVTSA